MFFLILLAPLFLFSAEVIEKRGFVIESELGKKYLSPQPGIKSCCIAKKEESIELVGDFGPLPRYSAVTLKGYLVKGSDGLQLMSEKLAVVNSLSQKELPE